MRQGNEKARPFADLALDIGFPTEQVYVALGEVKPQSNRAKGTGIRTVRLMEQFNDSRKVFPFDADPRVVDLKFHRSPTIQIYDGEYDLTFCSEFYRAINETA
ncbi:MAG: hypothetical protein QF619_06395 [Candidatus Binatia bacterium]|jgi:hypothetical protein|nr:hypothetical protein [Candidatus Binatia bacterium]